MRGIKLAAKKKKEGKKNNLSTLKQLENESRLEITIEKKKQ